MRSTKLIAYFISCICCHLSLSASSATPIVDLGYAQYQGVPSLNSINNLTTTQFLGIRYGAAPTGSQRFRKPQLPLHTPGVQLANEQPTQCFQTGIGGAPTTPFRDVNSSVLDTTSPTRRLETRAANLSIPDPSHEGSEDCLFLNVYVPGDLGEKKGLPVIFWIHGGGYGESNSSLYNGNNLIDEAGGGVVAVVIQYRLGLFGFLAGEKVKEGGALNAGLLDQQAALQWVQTRSKFGGDPSKVTIWGESAGGGSVLQHVIANDGNTRPPLFRAAIASSTYLPPQYNYNDRIPELVYSEVVNRTNCSSARDTLGCLRAVDVNSLESANFDINKNGFVGTTIFVPVVDGSFITKRPTELLKAGKVNGDMLLSVTNAFEGTLFVDQSTAPTVQVADFVSQLFPNFGPQEINATTAQYADLGTNIFQVNAIMGESIFICPTYFLLPAFHGRAFKGEFAVPPALHGEDIPFYLPESVQTNITTFGKSFSESFLNFVLSLDPNLKWDPSNITPTWGLWNGATEMLFNVTEAGAPDIRSVTTSSALLKRCEFWQSVLTLTAQ